MKTLILSSVLFLTGCATNQYTINGVGPGEHQTLKVIGGIVLMGVVAKSLANSNSNYCTNTIKNTMGQTIGTISTVKQSPC